MDETPSLNAVLAFVRVADRRRIGLVAEELGVSRQAIASRVSAYEAAVGQTLVDRSHRCVIALTPAGHAVLPAARRLVEAAALHAREAQAVATGTNGVVRIGIFPRRTPLIDALIFGLERVDPGWRVEVSEQRPGPLTRALAYGELEAALTTRSVPNPHRDHIDRRPRKFETVESLPVGPWNEAVWVTWRTRWAGRHREALLEATTTAIRVLRRGHAARRRRESLRPGATGSRPGR
ncbi:LysR family transcriptional regulator [Patulibacter americanus]|uniref:LysR family transcriptional regulator n=1 Tax=Patulibacter americanus TaxID=588672 RepID=UPI0003B588FA|nr:LysR family transcriptional regulator [Patulibacter americanus]